MRKIKYIISFILAVAISISANAQQTKSITGLVLDEKGEPVIGASVIVPGTTNGTITNIDGKFSLNGITAEQKTIQVSYIGYVKQVVNISGLSNVNIKLVASNAELEEVVVVGYGVQKKAHLTGSIGTLNPEEITDLNSTNLASSLSGKITGVSVSGGNGRPGEAARVTIRNSSVTSTYSATSGFVPDNSPLYIIDDFRATESDFNNLEPSMIESISVLKDAAAAIYGSSSAYGVILVKTKRGSNNVPKITYSTQIGITDEVARTKMLSAYNYGKIWNAVRAADPTDTWDNKTELFQADELELMKNTNYDLLEKEWSSAMTQKHSINMNGGNDKANYFAGISYNTQDGNLGNINYERWNYRAGVDAKISNSVKASLQVSGDYGDQSTSINKISGSNGGETDYNFLLSHPRYIPDYVNGLPIASYGTSNTYTNDAQLYNFSAIQNLDNYSKTKSQNMTINSSIEYDFSWIESLKGLKLKFSYSKNTSNSKNNQYASNYTLYNFNTRVGSGSHLYNEDLIDMTSSNIGTIAVTNGNSLRRTTSQTDKYQINLTATYNRSFGKHDVGAFFTIEKREEETEYLVGEVLDPYTFTNGQSNGATGTQSTQFGRSESGLLSYAGRVNYSYSNKYLLEFLFRVDASTKFAPENYWGMFPSMSAGWVMSQEEWFQNAFPNIDFFKVRGSFGLLGSDKNLDAWNWMQFYNLASDKGPVFGSSTSSVISGSHISLPDVGVNRAAQWDNSYQLNGGIDLNILKNRLSATIDGYYYWDRDIFMSRDGSSSYPATVGTKPAAENYGSIDRYGAEISLNWKDKIGDFKYGIRLSTGLSDDRVLVKPWESLIAFNEVHPGQRTDVGSWGYECIGMFRSYQDIEEYFNKYNIVSYMGLSKSSVKPGMLIYNNIRGSQKSDGSYYGANDPNDPKAGYVDENDLVLISNRSNPYGFNLNLNGEWKGISLNARFSANWGGYSYIPKQARSTSSLISTATGYSVMQYTNLPSFWANDMFVYSDVLDANGNVVAEQNLTAKYPNLRYYSVNSVESTFWRVSSTTISLNEVTLAYSIPKKVVKALTIESCRLNLTAQNVLSLYNPYPDNFMDPMAGTYGKYPNLRKITVGINVTF